MSDAQPEMSLPELPAPRLEYALKGPDGVRLNLLRNSPLLRAGVVLLTQGTRSGYLAANDLLPPSPWNVEPAPTNDDLFALLDAGVLRNPAWLTAESPPPHIAQNPMLAAMRETARALAGDALAPRVRCSICIPIGLALPTPCEHARVAARALRDLVREDLGLLFECVELVDVVRQQHVDWAPRYAFARPVTFVDERLGVRHASSLDALRRERTPWRAPARVSDERALAVRFACDAWGERFESVSPAPNGREVPPIALDLDAPPEERLDVQVVLPPEDA